MCITSSGPGELDPLRQFATFANFIVGAGEYRLHVEFSADVGSDARLTWCWCAVCYDEWR
jgi:hypothetical protein